MSYSRTAGNAADLQGGLEPLNEGDWEPFLLGYPAMEQMVRVFNDYEEVLMDLDFEVHKDWLEKCHIELKTVVAKRCLTRLYRNIHQSVPLIVPHGETEWSSKSAAAKKYAQKKRCSQRFNVKEERNRKRKLIAKLVQKVESSEKRDRPDIKPHALTDSLAPLQEFMGDLGKYLGSFEGKESDDIIRHAENICILAYDFYKVKNFSDFFVAVISYMKFYIKTSVTSLVTTMVSVLTEKDDDSVSSADVSAFLDDSEVFELHPQALAGRDVLDSWELLKTNTIFKKISFLITAAMSSSICSIKELNFDIGGISLISLEAMQEQCKATDLIDALIQTFVWVSETGWWCLKEQSLAPILYQDQRMRVYTEDCNSVIAYSQTAMAGNLSEQDTKIDLEEYERKLDKCLKATGEIQKVTSSPGVKELLQKKYAALVQIKMDLVAKRKNTAFRFAPIGFSIYGESSIGKSDIAPLTMKTSLSAMGFSTAQEGLITLNETDKYESTYTSDVMGVYIDDANNANSKFVEKSPTQKYIQFFNNVAAQAVKAELNEKGCVFINFKCGVLTTNTKTLGAQNYSNYPVAVLRRFYHVEATVKGKYCRPNGKSLNTDHPDIVNAKPGEYVDVWNFSIEEVIPNGEKMGRFEIVQLELVKGKGLVECKNLNLQRYLLAITVLSRNHKAKQVRQVERSTLLESFSCCSKCNLIPQYCACECEPVCKPHSLSDECVSYVTKSVVKDISKRIFAFFNPFMAGLLFSSACQLLPVREVQAHLDMHLRRNVPFLVSYTPSWLFSSAYGQRIVNQYFSHYECVNVLNVQNLFRKYFLFIVFLFSISCGYKGMLCSAIFCWMVLMVCESFITLEKERFNEILENRRDEALTEYGRSLRDGWLVSGTVATISLVGIVTILKAWNVTRRSPHSIRDPKHNDASPGWFGFMLGKSGKKIECEHSGATSDQLCNSVEKNLCWGRFTLNNGQVNKCGVFVPRKSIILFPKHIFYPKSQMSQQHSDSLSIEVIRHNSSGGKFSVKVNKDFCYHFPNKDLVACFVPNSPDFASKKHWFPKSNPVGTCLASMICPNSDGSKRRGAISPQFKRVAHSFLEMDGAEYKTHMARDGACMSPIISEGKNPCIVGFHIGGDSHYDVGISMTITQSELDLAETFLEERCGYLSAEATEIPKQQMGVDLLTTTTVNPKAKYIASMTSDNFVDVLGSTKIRSEQKSQVIPSILTHDVKEVCGVPNTWGPPKLRPNWDAYNKNAELFSKPGEMFDPALLDRAQKDWEEPLLVQMDSHASYEEGGFRPLTMKESILGIPGKKYVDALPMNTGIGFPLFGKKNKKDKDGNSMHFDEIFDGEQLLDRIPKEHVQLEINRLLDCYNCGIRAYPVTSATLKDEPTPLHKEKVRVFQAAPVALSIIIRKYFLPIARFLHLHPLLAESAVGVNAFSKDWQELMEHAEKFGDDDKMLAWDYSKYDVRMNSQVTRKVWDSFIHLAERGGYDEQSLRIMKNMIVDITHPLMDLNGTMLMAFAMNTSGNNLTVDVNGTAGSFYVRMGFFSIYPKLSDFRKHVALLTYGDDAKGSNTKETREFNFISYKRFLAQHGMKLTLPTKTDDEIEFLTREETDFLKRTSVYIPEIGCDIGKLDEMSIFKSLHSNVKSATATPREVAASVIETALHEWFAFGREHYEMRREQMYEVCNRQNLPVRALTYTFDDRVAFWKEKYQEV